jgi:isocitrate lyase
MFQLDDKFLQELGLDQLPDDQKQAFKEHIYSQLELRVGTRLSEGLTDQQLAEFESFIDRDGPKVQAWVTAHSPNYTADPSYQQLKTNAPKDIDDAVILAEYASLKWLSLNRPDYQKVVAEVIEEIKQEIKSNRDAILGTAGQADYTPAA